MQFNNANNTYQFFLLLFDRMHFHQNPRKKKIKIHFIHLLFSLRFQNDKNWTTTKKTCPNQIEFESQPTYTHNTPLRVYFYRAYKFLSERKNFKKLRKQTNQIKSLKKKTHTHKRTQILAYCLFAKAIFEASTRNLNTNTCARVEQSCTFYCAKVWWFSSFILLLSLTWLFIDWSI